MQTCSDKCTFVKSDQTVNPMPVQEQTSQQLAHVAESHALVDGRGALKVVLEVVLEEEVLEHPGLASST